MKTASFYPQQSTGGVSKFKTGLILPPGAGDRGVKIQKRRIFAHASEYPPFFLLFRPRHAMISAFALASSIFSFSRFMGMERTRPMKREAPTQVPRPER